MPSLCKSWPLCDRLTSRGHLPSLFSLFSQNKMVGNWTSEGRSFRKIWLLLEEKWFLRAYLHDWLTNRTDNSQTHYGEQYHWQGADSDEAGTDNLGCVILPAPMRTRSHHDRDCQWIKTRMEAQSATLIQSVHHGFIRTGLMAIQYIYTGEIRRSM